MGTRESVCVSGTNIPLYNCWKHIYQCRKQCILGNTAAVVRFLIPERKNPTLLKVWRLLLPYFTNCSSVFSGDHLETFERRFCEDVCGLFWFWFSPSAAALTPLFHTNIGGPQQLLHVLPAAFSSRLTFASGHPTNMQIDETPQQTNTADDNRRSHLIQTSPITLWPTRTSPLNLPPVSHVPAECVWFVSLYVLAGWVTGDWFAPVMLIITYNDISIFVFIQ